MITWRASLNFFYRYFSLFSFTNLKEILRNVKDLWGADLTPWTVSMKEGSPISHVTCTIRRTKANWQLQYQLLKPILHIMQIWGARKMRGAHIVYIFVNA